MNEPPLEPNKYFCHCGNLAEWFVIVVAGNAFDKGLELDRYNQVRSVDRYAACDTHLVEALYKVTSAHDDANVTFAIRRENRQWDSLGALEES